MNAFVLNLFFSTAAIPGAGKECNGQPSLETILAFLKVITVIPKEMSSHSFMFCGFQLTKSVFRPLM